MPTAPFVIVPELQSISIAYRNQKLIADQVLPRIPVGKQDYRYTVYPTGQFLTVPDTKVGRTSAPNKIVLGGDERTGHTDNYALDIPVPQDDIDNASGTQFNPLGSAVETGTNLIELDRETRVAAKVFNPDSYASGNKIHLGGQGEEKMFSTSGSDPIGIIEAALNVPMARPNKIVIGQGAWSVLRGHPDIVSARNRTEGSKGLASRQEVADMFEVEEIIVGQGWINIAKPGQPVVKARVWGKNIALIYLDPTAKPDMGITFGWTAVWGQRIAGTINDPDVGSKGGVRVRSGESVEEKIACSDAAYFIENAAA